MAKPEAQNNVPVKFRIRSKATSFLVSLFPHVRGKSLLVSSLLHVLPLDPTLIMEVKGKAYELDLRYRSQLGMVVGKPEVTESAILLRCLREGDVFFDIGSNWGYYTLLAATQIGARGLVVAAEANVEPFGRLLRVAHKAALTNVLPLNVAISDADGEQVAIRGPWYRSDTGGFIIKRSARSDSSVVTTRTLDSIWVQIGCPSVRGVKIDVEGVEPLVIRGGQKFFSEGVTDFALVEVSSWAEARCGVPYSEAYERLRELGFERAFTVEADGALVRVEMPSAAPPADKNVLFSKRGTDLPNE